MINNSPMDNRSTSLELLQASLLKIGQRAHELNKSVGPAIDFLLLFPTESLPLELLEKVSKAHELCSQAHVTLAALSWGTDDIRYQAQKYRILKNSYGH